MTEKEALEKSLEMWTWLRDQALEGKYCHKSDWFEAYNIPMAYKGCYLCEYSIENSKKENKCIDCPIKTWSKGNLKGVENFSYHPCIQSGSPFMEWVIGMEMKCDNKIIEGASEIVNLLEWALKNLKENI